ncbi:MAG: 4-(cytidine 5'-diphospho)-2-C-methyl-D-erythritol kinase [Phycisphaerae bacterium]
MSDTITDTLVATGTACAKINLTLDVLGARADGYHEIRSVTIGVDLRDEIHVSRSRAVGIAFSCGERHLAWPGNLVPRAANELACLGNHQPRLAIELHKNIPTGSGLGGGSSDAATTLSICARLWRLGLSRDDLARIGARLGSDVPLFFHLPAALMVGRGELVKDVTMRWSGWVLLVSRGVEVRTADVYANWRPADSAGALENAEEQILSAGSAQELNALASNHLQPAVFRVSPEVAQCYHLLNERGHGPMTITGAGSTMYRLFDDEQEAHDVAGRIEAEGLGLATAVRAAPVGQGPIWVSEEA